ncbi:MAG: hypothetical protein KGL35_13895 [Bradyrhizobium sp.]|nr:hypothetical protein [Bradyrhizobium sp.]
MISRRIFGTDEDRRHNHNAEVIAMLNARHKGDNRIFAPTVARIDESGYVWLMNRREGGWDSFGFRYASIREILSSWLVNVSGLGRDKHSEFYLIEPA